MLYYMVNTLFFWTLGVKNIVQDAAPEKEANKGFFSKEVWKKVFSPPLIGFFIALLLVLLNFRLPIFLERSFQYVGNLTTPLSLIFIGIEMSKITFKDIGLDKIYYLAWLEDF